MAECTLHIHINLTPIVAFVRLSLLFIWVIADLKTFPSVWACVDVLFAVRESSIYLTTLSEPLKMRALSVLNTKTASGIWVFNLLAGYPTWKMTRKSERNNFGQIVSAEKNLSRRCEQVINNFMLLPLFISPLFCITLRHAMGANLWRLCAESAWCLCISFISPGWIRWDLSNILLTDTVS